MNPALKAARYASHANDRAKRRSDHPGKIRARDLLALLPLTTCAYCAGPADTWDHVVPLSRGGVNALSNLTPCCEPCNRRKGASLVVPRLQAEPLLLPLDWSQVQHLQDSLTTIRSTP